MMRSIVLNLVPGLLTLGAVVLLVMWISAGTARDLELRIPGLDRPESPETVEAIGPLKGTLVSGDGVPSGVDPADALAQLRNGAGSVPPPARPARAAPKIGRNDPCPCGSGKKFKQCHGRAFDDDEQPSATA